MRLQKVKDHEIRELVNTLRGVAEKYHSHGSLRERICSEILDFIDDGLYRIKVDDTNN